MPVTSWPLDHLYVAYVWSNQLSLVVSEMRQTAARGVEMPPGLIQAMAAAGIERDWLCSESKMDTHDKHGTAYLWGLGFD